MRIMSIPRHIRSAGIAALLFVSAACASTSGRVYLRVGPPPAVVERRIDAPGPGYVWQPGYYRWDGREYRWMPGHYELAPRARATWVPGHWEHDRRGFYWVDGRWR